MNAIKQSDIHTYMGTEAEMLANIVGVETGSNWILLDSDGAVLGKYLLVETATERKWSDQSAIMGGGSTTGGDANLQVGDVAVSDANPVPVDIVAGGASANLQVDDVKVDDAHPVPVEIVAGGAPANLQVSDTEVDNTNPVPVKEILGSLQVGTDSTITFANSDGANTQVTLDITAPTEKTKKYLLSVYNPSTVTALTIKILVKLTTFGSGTRYGWLKTMMVPAAQTFDGTAVDTFSEEITSLFAEGDARLVISNDTGLGGSDGFSAYARLREAE